MIKEFVKDMVKYLPARIVPVIVGVLSIPIITHLLPAGDYLEINGEKKVSR